MATTVHRAAKATSSGAAVRQAGAARRPLLRVLFLHHDLAKVDLCLDELRGAGTTVSSQVARTAEGFSRELGSRNYDLVLAQYPGAILPGVQALERLRAVHPDRHIPLIFVADKLRRETAADLVSQGAADCIDADHLGHLPVAIRRALDEGRLRDERDRAEKQLRHSEAHYRALVGNLAYGMCRCDLDGRFQDANQALVLMLGYPSREALMAANLAGEILRDPLKREQLLGRALDDAHVVPLETQWPRQDGTLVQIRLSGRDVGSDDGTPRSYELIVEDMTKQRELEDHLRELAARDPLTGLANYRHLASVLDGEIKRSRRTGREFAVLLFDVDGLKRTNDQFGHVVGSQVLCRVADVLCIFSRETDTAARLGGDEFALVLPETSRVAALLVADRIRDRLGHERRKPVIGLSVGVAVYPQDGAGIDTLLTSADIAMYAMKDRHRARPAAGLRPEPR